VAVRICEPRVARLTLSTEKAGARTVFGNGTALDDAVIGVVLHAREEKHAIGIE